MVESLQPRYRFEKGTLANPVINQELLDDALLEEPIKSSQDRAKNFTQKKWEKFSKSEIEEAKNAEKQNPHLNTKHYMKHAIFGVAKLKSLKKSANEIGERLNGDKPIKVESASFQDGVKNTISGITKVINGVCNLPHNVPYDLVNGDKTFSGSSSGIKDGLSEFAAGVEQVAGSSASYLSDLADEIESKSTPGSIITGIFSVLGSRGYDLASKGYSLASKGCGLAASKGYGFFA